MRLARFNVLSRREESAGKKEPGKYTLGLSIPMSASVLVLMVIVTHNVGKYLWLSESFVAAIVLVLSYLMVSRVHFRSFKDLRMTKRTVGTILLLVATIVVVALAGVDKAVLFLALVMAYIILGFTETMILVKRHFVARRQLRHAENQAALVTTAAVADCAPEEPPADEEVLAELGAFDAPDPRT
jgi:CDP-diacylglycerol--serine O-phosphatidyltransferase